MPTNNVNLINLTPHTINIFDGGKEVAVIPASGMVARCNQSAEQVGCLNGIPVYRQTFGDVQGLPTPSDGTIYIVSRLVAAAIPNRNDLAIPGALVRGADGQPVGCEGLSIL